MIPTVTSRGARNLLSFAGITMMLTSVFVYTPDTDFPGAAALLPTIGTALVIHAGAGGDAFINRMLSVRPMVFIGLISYSLYLWHWPIVVFAKQVLINEWTDLEASVILAVIILLSTLSWRFVETPFRNRRLFAPRERLFAIFMAVPELCSIGREDVPPTFLFWGDSHALSMASAVHLSAQRQDAAGLLAIRTACPPLLSIDRTGETSCHEFNQSILAYVSGHPEIETVILAAR